ncbi:MerR family transcriptional regulator [Campylobacter devanensis]|uniref:MerR family transcriptional regulator n=1 Tax=Campylobacter devanensis TaxID=3161138 RepID=UPI000A3484B9|nr:MerR family transcriptional regulator [Campylobacter sp. P0227]
MAYTIIEVSQKTGVSPRTLRYWCDNGLFPLIERSSGGARYFSKSDVEWVEWVVRFRKMGCAWSVCVSI